VALTALQILSGPGEISLELLGRGLAAKAHAQQGPQGVVEGERGRGVHGCPDVAADRSRSKVRACVLLYR
jgi:hypothetical protein